MNTDINNTSTEFEFKGVPASPGCAIGKAVMYRRKAFDIQSSTIRRNEVLDHLNEFKKARIKTVSELQVLKNEAIDHETAEILSAQIEMVNDPELADQVENLIKEELYAVDFAIQQAFELYIDLMSNSRNEHTRERSVDVTDTRDRLLEIVKKEGDLLPVEDDCIIVTSDLSPREVISLIKHDIDGIIMNRGGATSHAAIIARSMGIPAIVGAKRAMDSISANDLVAMDGDSGNIFVHPSEETILKFEQTIEETYKQEQKLKEVIEKASVTCDGHAFILRANIEFAEELDRVREVKATGIGLLRTESIYLEKEHFKDTREQEHYYRSILEETGSEPVTIRLFDAGGDKIIKEKQREQNPFLGWRGIRMLLDKRELLREQLHAILATAGAYPGRVNILVPMVTVIEEVADLKKEIEDVQNTLESKGKDVDRDVPLGIMVEVPSVAVQANKFAALVDFLSIGTNDLTQYMLAIDRGNELIADIYDQRHPAVWNMIKSVAEAGRAHNINVTVCGELASDPVSAACLLGMGISDLSMSPSRIPYVKNMLIRKHFSDMEKLAERVIECSSSSEVNELFKNWSKK